MLPKVYLKRGVEKKIRSAYPWVQREEVGRADECEPGGIAHLVAADGSFLAIGTFNPQSRFPFKVFDLTDTKIDSDWFSTRFRKCLKRRMAITGTDAKRIIFAEADGIPGLIVDQYGSTAIVQVRSLGIELLKPQWIEPLREVFELDYIFEKSDMAGRKEEGLEDCVGELFGALPEIIEFEEDGFKFEADVRNGLKTGFYLDQRDTRRRLRQRIAKGERVLDAFCYTGACSVYAASKGAKVTGVDIHAAAVELARHHAEINNLSSNCSFIEANAFDWLSETESTEKFDWMILDPPAIAKDQDKKTSLKWAIWKLVYHGIDHLKEGGRMVVCNCSYQLSLNETIETIRLAAGDRGKLAFLEEVTIQSPDHPHLIQFPESLYLKCVWVRIEDL